MKIDQNALTDEDRADQSVVSGLLGIIKLGTMFVWSILLYGGGGGVRWWCVVWCVVWWCVIDNGCVVWLLVCWRRWNNWSLDVSVFTFEDSMHHEEWVVTVSPLCGDAHTKSTNSQVPPPPSRGGHHHDRTGTPHHRPATTGIRTDAIPSALFG
jgi:hypothetical protein